MAWLKFRGRLRAVFTVIVIVWTWAAPAAAQMRRGFAPVGRAGVVHGTPANRFFPGRPFFPFRPFFPGFFRPGFGFWGPFGGPFWGFRAGWGFSSLGWQGCGISWGLGYGCNLLPIYIGVPSVYFYGGGATELVQLYFKDGTVSDVTDYWLANRQLHFVTPGDKSAERTVDFEGLDLQRTVDANTERGFRFVLRNEPIGPYLRDHPEMMEPGAPQHPPAPAAPSSGAVPPKSQPPQP